MLTHGHLYKKRKEVGGLIFGGTINSGTEGCQALREQTVGAELQIGSATNDDHNSMA